jgi:hypothetical protein
MRKPVTNLEALTWLLGSALAVAFARALWRSHFLQTPQGTGAMTDLLGVLLTAFTMFAVLALRGLASGSSRAAELEDGVAALAGSAWAFALVPPRPENYLLAGAPDDFIYALVPMALVIGVAVRGLARLPRTPRGQLQRVGLLSALGLLIDAVAVWAIGGAGSQSFVQRALLGTLGMGVLSAASFVRRRANP